MLTILANGDFHVAPNALLVVFPILTFGLVAMLVVWLVRMPSRAGRVGARWFGRGRKPTPTDDRRQ